MKKVSMVFGALVVLAILAMAGCGSSPPSQTDWNDHMCAAAIRGNLAVVRSALENGANINFQYEGSTALMFASGLGGNFEIVRYLVEHGADLNLRDTYGSTALHKAFAYNHLVIARYLIDSGINVNARDRDGKSALNLAYEKGEMELYNYLLAHGAVEFEPNQVAQQPAAPTPSSTTNVYVQPSAPAQSPAPPAPTFQTGTYGWSNSNQNMTMQFSAGIVTANLNYRQIWFGTYRINGTQLVISVNNTISEYSQLMGMTYFYTITSSTSFSGSGETWVRTGF